MEILNPNKRLNISLAQGYTPITNSSNLPRRGLAPLSGSLVALRKPLNLEEVDISSASISFRTVQIASVHQKDSPYGCQNDDPVLPHQSRKAMTLFQESPLSTKEIERLKVAGALHNPNGIRYEANMAVDNNTENRYLHGECAQTEMQARPYWYVDLADSFVVNHVKLILPKDCCVGDLHNFEIRVGDNSDQLDLNTICKHHMGTALKTVLNIECDKPTMGRYVSVQMLGDETRTTDTLTLCEVMVFT